MRYVFRGIISEIIVEEDKLSFKVIGTEGFSIKQGENRFNVLCPKNLANIIKKNNSVSCVLLSKDFQFFVKGKKLISLLSNYPDGKKIELKIQSKNIKKIKSSIKISSIKILQN